MYYGVRKDLFLNLLISEFEFFCFQSKWQKENAASKIRINTKFYNKNTIESELGGSNFNSVFTLSSETKKDAILFFDVGLELTQLLRYFCSVSLNLPTSNYFASCITNNMLLFLITVLVN